MKRKMSIEKVNKAISYLTKVVDDSKSGVFMLEAFEQGKLDEKTVRIIKYRLSLYLKSWVIPDLEFVLKELEK